jgi:hypothetical protein
VAILAGSVLTSVGIINYRDRPRGSAITSDMFAIMVMPRFERLARGYPRMHGYPESDWPRFQHRAIADIIMQAS